MNQYYWPGKEATASLLTELCEALAVDHEVTVVVGAAPGEPERSNRDGVTIVRVHSTTYDRSLLWRRASNYFTYLLGALREALTLPRPDVVVCMTDPPFIGAAAELVARRFRVPLLVISQDVFPEVAVKLGRLRNPVAIAMLRVVIVSYLRHATRVVVIGETMKERVVAKGVQPERVRVISNWGDAERVTPQSRANKWARKHHLVDKFVVMHFGNVGHAQDLDSLIRATTLLRDLDDLAVPIIGVGARLRELTELAETLEADAVRFLPWQAYESRARARRRACARPLRVCRPEQDVGRARRRAPGDRGGRGGVGDGGGRPGDRMRPRRSPGQSVPARRGDPRVPRRRARPRGDGPPRPRVRGDRDRSLGCGRALPRGARGDSLRSLKRPAPGVVP
jgi:glycosyltransferase involved in cell wall biosynthesis